MRHARVFLFLLFVLSCVAFGASAQLDYDVDRPLPMGAAVAAPFFPEATYSPEITPPEDMIGRPVGAGLVPHAGIIVCFRKWAEESPRVDMKVYARSHEGRELVRLVVTSADNLRRLDAIKTDIARLADPRETDSDAARRIISSTPAVAWLGYSIHGDELSGADASLAVAYRLIAGTDEEIVALLDDLVIVIDPVMNPDGRERIISMIRQSGSYTTNLDYASMHRGRWPWGRGNHYLFDMNRDWIVGIAPETRGRWRELLDFHPQLVVDAHEMGPLDTYLFYPAAEPQNPERPSTLLKWQKIFADRHGADFDNRGWAYYTREWVDGWYPGYSDAWSSLNGGIGMLYEQARLRGLPLKRPSGQVVTYASSVMAQAVSSLADLRTLAANRDAILTDYLAGRRLAIEEGGKDVFVLRPGRSPDREHRLINILLRQGIEVFRADKEFQASATGVLADAARRENFPAGSYLIPSAQPQGRILRALLEADPHMSDYATREERREIEQEHSSGIYDVTAWNLAQAFDVDGFWVENPGVGRTAIRELTPPTVGIARTDGERAFAWIVDGGLDASHAFAVHAMESGLAVHVADRDFTSAGRHFPRGSLLLRRDENGDEGLEARIAEAAMAAGVEVVPTPSGRSVDEGPDLGGRHFNLLSRPRVAVLTNWPVSPTSFGHVWHQLDVDLQVPFTLLDLHQLDRIDLRRYNVLVIPEAWGNLDAILSSHTAKLQSWVRGGGSLIALGSAAATLARESWGLTTTRLKRDVLGDLDAWQEYARRDLEARDIEVDTEAIWGNAEIRSEGSGDETVADGPGMSEDALQRHDEWLRRFSPHGVYLRGLVDTHSWLTLGCREEMPVFFDGSHAYVSRPPAEAPVRLAPQKDLRLSGLVWPEAQERLELTAWTTVERCGSGQIILFATSPTYRAFNCGTARMLANAVIYGPSMGADQPDQW